MIVAMLTRLGAPEAVLAWREHRSRRPARESGIRPGTFDEANLRRSTRAAVSAAVRVERALDILGQDAPEHLRAAGRLRLAHQQVSLEELGRSVDPPMTKDAVAGRIRRLLAMADKRAAELGGPGTDADLTPDLLDA
jgi:DNA-binding protein WhiA